jgi:hypothetical protein
MRVTLPDGSRYLLGRRAVAQAQRVYPSRIQDSMLAKHATDAGQHNDGSVHRKTSAGQRESTAGDAQIASG